MSMRVRFALSAPPRCVSSWLAARRLPARARAGRAYSERLTPRRYQVCLFCLQKLQQEHGNRCPGCRTLYGTDREEWQRQADARAVEAQSRQAQSAPKRSQGAVPTTAPGAPAREQRAPTPASEKPPSQGARATGAVSPPPASTSAGRTRLEPQHWPDLAPAKPAAAVRPPPQPQPQPAPMHHISSSSNNNNNNNHNHAPPSSEHANGSRHRSASSEAAQTPDFVSVPVTVQSNANGHSKRLETVLELRPPSPHEQQHFVPIDGGLEHLVGQFQQLSAADHAMRAHRQRGAPPPKPAPRSNHVPVAPAPPRAPPPSSVPFPPPGIAAFPPTRTNNGFAAPLASTTNLTASPKPANASVASKPAVTDKAYNPLSGAPVLGAALHDAAPAYNPFAAATLPLAAVAREPAKPNYLPQLFAPQPATSSGASWLSEHLQGSHDLWDPSAPLASLLPAQKSSYSTRRRALYERGSASSEAIAAAVGAASKPSAPPTPPPGLDAASQDPVISPRRLAAHAAPIGGDSNVQQ